MAKYPIRMLKDEEGNAFVPLTSSEALKTPDGKTLDEKLQNKLEITNIKAGTDINITVDGNNVTINNASKGVLIDNLTTETSGVGSLDAHQGKVLKEMIPEVVNNVTSTDSDKALSAYQGYLLSGKVVPTGGKEGQVLKKSSDTNWSLEWGDAADPNAIVGDGSIKKIVELTYEEYQALETIDPDTEYHITDYNNEIITNRVFGDDTNSDNDTYSCNYINDKFNGDRAINKIVVGEIKSKNKFNKNNVVFNYYLSYTDATPIWDVNMAYMIDYIEVKPHTNYTMSYNSSTIFIIHKYDKDKNWLGYVSQNDSNTYYTTSFGEETKYVRLCCGKICVDGIMFEESSTPSLYSPCQSFDLQLPVYRYEEQKVGIWTDGKPIYRKIITFTLSNSIPSDNNVGTINDVDWIIKLEATVKSNDNQVPLSVSWNREFDCGIMFNRSNNSIYIRPYWDVLAGASGFCIIEYTKTTD